MFDFIPLDVNLTHAINKLVASVHFGAFHEKVHLIVKHCLHHAKFFYCFTLFFFFHYALILLGKLQRHLKTQFFFSTVRLTTVHTNPSRKLNFWDPIQSGEIENSSFSFSCEQKTLFWTRSFSKRCSRLNFYNRVFLRHESKITDCWVFKFLIFSVKPPFPNSFGEVWIAHWFHQLVLILLYCQKKQNKTKNRVFTT